MRIDDPKYYLYYRLIGHLTKDCHILKDKIQTLVDAKVSQLQLEKKKVLANMMTIRVGEWNVLAMNGGNLHPKGGMAVVNF